MRLEYRGFVPGVPAEFLTSCSGVIRVTGKVPLPCKPPKGVGRVRATTGGSAWRHRYGW
jgi:hypothetical protein